MKSFLLCKSAIAKLFVAAIVIILVVGIAAGAYYVSLPAPSPSLSPTLISFEEAVEYALNISTGGHFVWRPWNYSEYRFTGELQGEPVVTENGLSMGYLARAGRLNNSLMFIGRVSLLCV